MLMQLCTGKRLGRYRSLLLTAARATALRCMAVARDAAQMVLCGMPQTSYAPPVFCVHRHSAESWTKSAGDGSSGGGTVTFQTFLRQGLDT